MSTIQFDIGVKSFSLNDKIDIYFNPTDCAFVESLYNVFLALDKKQESYKDRLEKLTDKSEAFDIAREMDAEMRQSIDAVLEAPVCDAVFGKRNVYSLANGFPIWANLILAIMDEIDSSFVREKKATDPRLQKYMAKYAKR